MNTGLVEGRGDGSACLVSLVPMLQLCFTGPRRSPTCSAYPCMLSLLHVAALFELLLCGGSFLGTREAGASLIFRFISSPGASYQIIELS